MVDESFREGGCHCGSVRFRVKLSDGLSTARRCDCSFCRMRGAVAVTAPLDGLEVVKGADKLTLYRFNTGAAKHYFCSVCGIIPIISGVRTRTNLASMLRALTASVLSIFRRLR